MQQLLMKQDLKKRNWTETAITRFLGEADTTKPSPHNRNQRIQLFEETRVNEVESTATFREWQESYLKKQKPPKPIPEIELLQLDAKELEAKAIDSYELHNAMSVDRPSQEFLERVQVNYLRHECSNYEELLRGAGAHSLIKNKVLMEIARAYPHLANEAYSQMLR